MGADSPQELLRGQLWWAIVHDMRKRVRLLIQQGVDFLTAVLSTLRAPMALRSSDGYTPAELSALSGCPEVAGGHAPSQGIVPSRRRDRPELPFSPMLFANLTISCWAVMTFRRTPRTLPRAT
jgi:hypothetical protein